MEMPSVRTSNYREEVKHYLLLQQRLDEDLNVFDDFNMSTAPNGQQGDGVATLHTPTPIQLSTVNTAAQPSLREC
jgi:hypothetical protein